MVAFFYAKEEGFAEWKKNRKSLLRGNYTINYDVTLESTINEKRIQRINLLRTNTSLRYISLYRLFDQLGDKDKEDVAWVLKQRIAGLI